MPLDFTDLIPDDAPGGQSTYERNKAWAKPGPSKYATDLSPQEETKFQGWVKANKVPFDPGPKADYDMRGFWKALDAGDPKARSAVDPNDKRLHYPDYWKTPYHETFSNESQWADPIKAPKWNDKDQLVGRDGKIVFDDRAPKNEFMPDEPRKALSFDDLIPAKTDKIGDLLKDYDKGAHDLSGAVSRVTGAMGRGYKEGFEGTPPLIAPPAQAELDRIQRAGGLPGALSNLLSLAADDIHAPLAVIPGLIRGGQAGVQQLGEEMGNPRLGREIAAIPESLPGLDRFGIPAPREVAPLGIEGPAAGARPRVEPTFDQPPGGGAAPAAPEPIGPRPRLTGPAPEAPPEPAASPAAPSGGVDIAAAKAALQQGVEAAQRNAAQIQELRARGATPQMLAPAIAKHREQVEELQRHAEQVRDMESAQQPAAPGAAPVPEPEGQRQLTGPAGGPGNPWEVVNHELDFLPDETPQPPQAAEETPPAPTGESGTPEPAAAAPPEKAAAPTVETFQDQRTVGYDRNPDHPLAGRIEHLREMADSPDLLPREQRDLKRRVRDFEQFNTIVADLPLEQRAMVRSLSPDDIIQGKDAHGRTIVGRVEGFGRDGLIGVTDQNGLHHEIHAKDVADVRRVARGGLPATPPAQQDDKKDEPTPDLPPPVTAYGGPWTPALNDKGEPGKNHMGDQIYENTNGVRAILDDGVPFTESTTETEKGLVPKNPGDRKRQFLVEGEKWAEAETPKPKAPPKSANSPTKTPTAEKPKEVEAESPTETGGKPTETLPKPVQKPAVESTPKNETESGGEIGGKAGEKPTKPVEKPEVGSEGETVPAPGQSETAPAEAEKPPAPETPKPTEHPGLVIKSLETGKETVIQPIGTVPPSSFPVLSPEAQKEKYDTLNPADTSAATGELKPGQEQTTSDPKETPNAGPVDERPRDGDLGKPAGGGTRAPRSRARKPKGKRNSEGLAPQPATDDAPAEGAGDRGEDGVRPGSEAKPGEEAVHPVGDAPDGRGGTGDDGVADVGSGDGDRVAAPAAIRPNFFIDDPTAMLGGTPKVRFARNRAAMEALAAIEEEQRPPTEEDLANMASFTGWGSFGQDLFQGTFEYQRPRQGWDAEGKWLREHLGKEAWEGAQRSIINAHYTDPPTVQAMWDMVQHMGFKGGRVLEPSMGVGNFFGMMPRDLMANSNLTGIELDPTTAKMAKYLYPRAGVHNKRYEHSQTPDGFYDLVIGNWPFSNIGPSDRRYDKLSPTLHDYFYLKALDQTRPGGLVVGITSAGTMDKAGRAVRIELAKKGELVASFRLPSGAFEEYAGTNVVTDIIVLRKREEPVNNVMQEGWIDTIDMPTPEGNPVRVNQYYQDHPSNVLGQIDWGHRTTTGQPGMIVHRPDDLRTRMAALPGTLPTDAYVPKKRGGEPRFVMNSTTERLNAITVGPDGKLYQVAGERMMLLDDVFKGMGSGTKAEKAKREAQVRSLVDMRRSYGQLIDAERDALPNAEELRGKLREQYESFTGAHGRIANSLGATVMRRVKDPSLPILESLELPDGTPARILTQPVVRSKRSINDPSISDAYVIVRNESAILDLDRVAEIASLPRDQVEAELVRNGAVYRTPGGGFEPSDAYLSGNVRRKLREAEDALDRGEDMQRSVDALKTVLPETVPYFQIEAKLGSTWVSDDHYKEFIGDMLGLTPDQARDQVGVRFAGGRWRVDLPDRAMRGPEATSTHGHPRYRFDKLVRAAMSNTSPKIFTRTPDGTAYDSRASEEVAAKIQQVREKFQDWAWKDAERKITLETAFNEVMNAIAKPHFDGSFMDMSGMALRRGDDPFALRRHQVNAIWRGVQLGRGLFAHEVGTGKTYTIAGIAVEGRRYGKFSKPVVFAHNANSASVAKESQDMYPGAKIMYIDNTLAPAAIEAAMYRIANEDWDMVVMPHSLIDRIGLSRETLMELAQDDITALETEAMEAAAEDNQTLTPDMMDDPKQMKKIRNLTAKQLVKQREAIIAKIDKMAAKASRENAIPFEKLGIDAIIVDEAHEFKKPSIATQMQLKGLNTKTSDRSIALQFLTGFVKKNNAGNGVYLFTGTPVTNSLNEIFNMSRYFMDDTLARDGIDQWDAWFNTFADATPDLELTDAGDYETVTRLSSFVNVDELVRVMSQYTDVVQAKDMPEFVDRATDGGKTLGSPNLTDKERDFLENGYIEKPTGRPYKRVINDVGELTTDQTAILSILQEQSRYFKNASRKDRKEMMLAGDERVPIQVGTNASNASLDARMYNPAAIDDPKSKINRVTKNVLDIYQAPNTAQMIFVDRGYNGGKKNPNFTVVDELVRKLVEGGIPREEIAIVAGDVKPEKKKAIADGMNNGRIRVAIGQSGTMGVGVNAQANLRAMHHMDAPWRPGDLEQRNGRGHRQGNRWNTVLEYRYITEGLDGRRWQVLTTKDRFIKQFINAFNDTSGKRIGVIEGDAADISEDEDIMSTLSAAAGDPRLMQKEKYKADINRLERRERIHAQGVVDAKDRARAEAGNIKAAIKRVANSAEVIGQWDDAQARMEEASKAAGSKVRWYDANIGGKEMHTSEEIQDGLDNAVRTLSKGEKDLVVGTINGISIMADWRRSWDIEPSYSLADANGEDLITLTGLTMPRIIGSLRSIREDVERLPASLAARQATIDRLNAAAQEPFAQGPQLATKRQQLAKLEDDLQANPIPPPGWLRHGAPLDSPIWVGGEERIVRGHRMADDYYLVTDQGDVLYLDATDENGSRIYEAHPKPQPPPKPDEKKAS